MMSRVLSALSIIALFTFPAAAQEEALETQSAQIIQSIGDRIIETITSKTLSQAQKHTIYRDIISTNVAFKTIGRFVLGRYVHIANDREMEEFLELFQEEVLETLIDLFDAYANEKLAVSRVTTLEDATVIVKTKVIRPASDPISIDWKIVRAPTGSVKIYDLFINGISMSQAKREEYGALIQKNNRQIDPLLKILDMRVKARKASDTSKTKAQ